MYYENFADLCKKHNVKPGAVSRATGVSTTTLTAWKQGKYTPKVAKLQLIADYFKVPLDVLMGEDAPIEGISPESWDYYLDVKESMDEQRNAFAALTDEEISKQVAQAEEEKNGDDPEERAYYLGKLIELANKLKVEDLATTVFILRKVTGYDELMKERNK